MCAAISVATFVHEAASFVRYSFNSGCSTLSAKRAHSVARSTHSRASLCTAAAPLIVRYDDHNFVAGVRLLMCWFKSQLKTLYPLH